MTVADNFDLEGESSKMFTSEHDDEFSNNETLHEGNEDATSKKVSVETMTRWTKLFAFLILLLGCIASTGFLYVGIKAIHEDSEDQFIRNAGDLALKIESAWNDYEVAGLWIHEACRSRSFSRSDFRVLYEYLKSGGLDFQAAEFIPNVTREERDAFEADSRAYYQQNYPNVLNYTGFRGLEPNPLNTSDLVLQNRSEQPFYFPVHYVEPVDSNAAAVDFDLWSSSSRRATIQQALDTWQATMTARLRIVQETDLSAYSVLLMHPGAPLESQPLVKPRDLSLMVIRIPSLIERAAGGLNGRKTVYIYDSTKINDTASDVFLGAASLDFSEAARKIEFLPETELSTLRSANSGRLSYILEKHVRVASREWTIAVVEAEDQDPRQMIFVIMGGVVIFLAALLLSGWMIQHVRRVSKMYSIAAEAEAGNLLIVRELFPSNVRDRLIADASAAAKQRRNKVSADKNAVNKNAFLNSNKSSGLEEPSVFGTAPIADLFPNVTIMFADLVGFTAWSSVREPGQVFTLLETVYHGFDEIAKRRRIFKVETVGDCYVAAAGVPEPRQDHAVVMARFASECQRDLRVRTQQLEKCLGPDTGDLQMRIGLHSGEVTAGVLRGLKGRFQLFGDSMNMASRMESTGLPERIQVSQETGVLLKEAGKGHWLTPRSDKVVAKGKGELQTYWLDLCLDYQDMTASTYAESLSEDVQETAPTGAIPMIRSPSIAMENRIAQHANYNKKVDRLVEWNVEAMSRMLRDILAKRISVAKKVTDVEVTSICPEGSTKTILDCATDHVDLLTSRTSIPTHPLNPSSIDLGSQVLDELKSFVSSIALLYRKVPFHNFEHASHVAMSVSKLFGRIVQCADPQESPPDDYTLALTLDPMTHFACFFAALVHDVDHQGVSNVTLVKEQSNLVKIYRSKSVAEQNSVALAWELLQQSTYRHLRKCIYCDEEEMVRFRQLLVNLVMATDVMDKDLGAIRRERWERAFVSDEDKDSNVSATIEMGGDKRLELANRKAMIVLEHVIQASDVSHTMQHWHVYRKWNERLFHEMYSAYEQGRLEVDPLENWYESEKGFLDFYVIPLAKKLAKCGVFGVASYELMNYAVRNRNEWEQKGKEMVESYLTSYREQYDAGLEIQQDFQTINWGMPPVLGVRVTM